MSFLKWYPINGAQATNLVPTHPWDRVTIGGYTLPGHAKIINAEAVVKVDRKGGAGQNGATPTFHGLDPRPVDVEVFVWTRGQADALERVILALGPTPGVNPVAVPIDAQAIKHLPIDSVVVIGCSSLQPANEGGARGLKCKISCLHWLAPAAATAKKKTATTTPAHTVQNELTNRDNEKKNPPPDKQPDFCSFVTLGR